MYTCDEDDLKNPGGGGMVAVSIEEARQMAAAGALKNAKPKPKPQATESSNTGATPLGRAMRQLLG